MATIPLILPDALADDPSVATGVIVLEGVRYRLTFRWSPRDDRDGQWRLDVSDAAGVLRLAGVPLVTSEDVFAPYHYKGDRKSVV